MAVTTPEVFYDCARRAFVESYANPKRISSPLTLFRGFAGEIRLHLVQTLRAEGYAIPAESFSLVSLASSLDAIGSIPSGVAVLSDGDGFDIANAGELQNAINCLDDVAAAGYVEVKKTCDSCEGDICYLVEFRCPSATTPALPITEQSYCFPTSATWIVKIPGSDKIREVRELCFSADSISDQTWTTTTETPGFIVNTVQNGDGVKQSEIQEISLTPIPQAGTWALLVGGSCSDPLPFDASSEEIQRALLSLGHDTAVQAIGDHSWQVRWKNSVDQNPLDADTAGLIGAGYFSTTLDLTGDFSAYEQCGESAIPLRLSLTFSDAGGNDVMQFDIPISVV